MHVNEARSEEQVQRWVPSWGAGEKADLLATEAQMKSTRAHATLGDAPVPPVTQGRVCKRRQGWLLTAGTPKITVSSLQHLHARHQRHAFWGRGSYGRSAGPIPVASLAVGTRCRGLHCSWYPGERLQLGWPPAETPTILWLTLHMVHFRLRWRNKHFVPE